VKAVLSQYLLESPALIDFITAKVEATTTLSTKQRDTKLRKLNAELAELEKQHLEARKQAAMEQLEREFAGEAA
jgi:uncharacterized membrane protein YukC